MYAPGGRGPLPPTCARSLPVAVESPLTAALVAVLGVVACMSEREILGLLGLVGMVELLVILLAWRSP
jgi:hypothetical protein